MAQILKNEIREKIKDSALKVFSEKGFKKTSIKEIAVDANISVGNVYRYYKNKEDLYDDVIHNVYVGLDDLVTKVKETGEYKGLVEAMLKDPAKDLIVEPMKAFIDLYMHEKDVFTMLLNGERDEHYDKTVNRYISLLRKHFLTMWGTATLEYGLSEAETSALTHALVFGVIALIEEVDEAEMAESMTAFVSDLIKGYFYVRQLREASR